MGGHVGAGPPDLIESPRDPFSPIDVTLSLGSDKPLEFQFEHAAVAAVGHVGKKSHSTLAPLRTVDR